MSDMQTNTENNDYPRFISNKPSGIDRFTGQSQQRLTKAIAEYIANHDDVSKQSRLSRIIGLEGAWGSGKSNVIKQLEIELKDKYCFFEYDAWGHQEDLQRRSFLETLTTELINKKFLTGETKTTCFGKQTEISWNDKLKDLLAHKTIRKNKSIPHFNAGAFWTVLFLSLTPITTFISEKLEASCVIKSIFLLTLVAFSPIIFGLLLWLLFCISNKNMRHLGYLLQISKEENSETENHETINEEEPTVSKFNAWMSDLSNYITDNQKNKLVIIFDNMDRLPKDKVKELWSSIHTFFAEGEFDNIWTIIPFDEKHLSCAFGENEESQNSTKAIELTKYFISKTFPVVFRVASPVITDYRSIFTDFFTEAFGTISEDSEIQINHLYRLENPNATIRDIISFINKLVTLKLIWKSEIDILHIAIFVLRQDEILSNPVNAILSGIYFTENMKKIIKNDEDLQKNIAALVYGIDPIDAEQIPIRQYIVRCIKQEESSDINKYSSTNKHFFTMLDEIIIEEDNIYIDFKINAMSQLETSKLDNDAMITINRIWHFLYEQKISSDLVELKFEKCFEILLLNINDYDKKGFVEYLCKEYQNVSHFKDFKGENYWQAITLLKSFIKKNSINIELNLSEIQVPVPVFIDVVNEAEEKYKEFKIKTDASELEKYYIGRIPDKLSDAKVHILQYLSIDEDYSFKKLNDAIEKSINENVVTAENFGYIFFAYRSIQNKKNELSQKLTPPQVQSLWTNYNLNPTKYGYVDIAAIRFSLGHDVPLTEEQIEEVANVLDYYIGYGDILLKNLSLNNPSLDKVLKFMTEHKLGYIMNVESVLSKFLQIINKINVSAEVFLVQLNRWEKFKDSIKCENLESIIPKELYAFTIKTKNELTSYINDLAVQKISQTDADKLYSERSNVTTFYDFVVIDSLLGTEYLKKLPDNLNEFIKKILIDIASGNESIPAEGNFLKKIIDYLDSKKRGPVIREIRDLFCNHKKEISPSVFLYFIDWLEKQGGFEDRANDVVSTILLPIIDNKECLNKITTKADLYADIVNKADDDASEFKDKIEKMINNTDKDFQNFARKIGIKIKKENANSDTNVS